MKEDLKALQLEIEQLFSIKEIEKKHLNQWIPLLKPFLNVLENDGITDDDEVNNYLGLCIRVFYLLDDRPKINYLSLIEILMDKSDLENTIEEIAYVLDKGSELGYWEYDQLEYVNDANAMNVIGLYNGSKNYIEDKAYAMYKLPMIIKPEPVKNHKNNRGSGYLTDDKDSLLLGKKWYKGDICREHLDRCNSIPLKINKAILNHFEPRIDEDSIRDNVIMSNVTYGTETNPDKVIEQAKLNLANMIKQLNIGVKVLDDREIYLTHKVDVRGRCYCQGVHFNYQGDTFSKAVINLANERYVTDDIEFILD